MKKIVFTWELGSGLGHIMPIRQYCDSLSEYDVYVILRDIGSAGEIFSDTKVTILPAPYYSGLIENPVSSPNCYSDLLHNCGYFHSKTICSLVLGWKNILALIDPDLIVFDHSPTALLAARQMDVGKIIVGSGFLCPPVKFPLASFDIGPLGNDLHSKQVFAEKAAVNNINIALKSLGVEPLSRLSDIYDDVDRTLITAYEEFDHFDSESRVQEKYVGVLCAEDKGQKPSWPDSPGKNIFLYTHNFPNLGNLIQLFASSDHSVIIYSKALNKGASHELPSNIVLATEAVSIPYIASQCDIGITNGNFNTACQFALLGVPQILIPLQRDQLIFSRSLEKTGSTITADLNNIDHMHQVLLEMVGEYQRYSIAAKNLALKYKDRKIDPVSTLKQEIDELLDR